MTGSAEKEARLKEINHTLCELGQRLEELSQLMVDMVAQGKNTINQSELYYELLRTIKQLEAIRDEIASLP